MKQLFIAFSLFMIVFSFESKASIAFQVEGTLIVKELKNAPLDMKIITDEGSLTLTNVHTPYVSGCTYGTYIVVNNLVDDNYTLLEMVECLDDQIQGQTKDDIFFCPEIWMPVCAVLDKKIQTFGNICEMKAAKADFKKMAACL
jgi:hypothetical protein